MMASLIKLIIDWPCVQKTCKLVTKLIPQLEARRECTQVPENFIDKFLPGKVFAWKSFCLEKFLPGKVFAWKRFCLEKFYLEKFLPGQVFSLKSFYLEKFLPGQVFAWKSFQRNQISYSGASSDLQPGAWSPSNNLKTAENWVVPRPLHLLCTSHHAPLIHRTHPSNKCQWWPVPRPSTKWSVPRPAPWLSPTTSARVQQNIQEKRQSQDAALSLIALKHYFVSRTWRNLSESWSRRVVGDWKGH